MLSNIHQMGALKWHREGKAVMPLLLFFSFCPLEALGGAKLIVWPFTFPPRTKQNCWHTYRPGHTAGLTFFKDNFFFKAFKIFFSE